MIPQERRQPTLEQRTSSLAGPTRCAHCGDPCSSPIAELRRRGYLLVLPDDVRVPVPPPLCERCRSETHQEREVAALRATADAFVVGLDGSDREARGQRLPGGGARVVRLDRFPESPNAVTVRKRHAGDAEGGGRPSSSWDRSVPWPLALLICVSWVALVLALVER